MKLGSGFVALAAAAFTAFGATSVSLLAASWLLVCADSAGAQVASIPPKVVAVTKDGAPMRCRDGSPYYPVATIKLGTLLRADGQNEKWYRVEYPTALNAFVKADEVETKEGAPAAVRLTKPSRLMAANSAGGERANWWPLLDQDLPAGTEFPVVQALSTPDKKIYGYLVGAPAASRGYVLREFVRDATADEAARFAPASSPTTPSPPPAGPSVTPTVATPPGTTPTPAGGTPTPAAGTPAGAAGTPPATITMTNTPGGEAPQVKTAEQIAKDEEAARAARDAAAQAAARAADRKARVDNLVSLYQQVQSEPILDAEIDPVIAEFEKQISEFDASDASGRAAAKSLSQRLEVLKVRKDLQTRRRQVEATKVEYAGKRARIDDRIKEIMAQRAYTVIGRLMPSTVYDGERLPRMYRVQSPDTGSSRTLGYVAPTESFDPLPYVGRVVGIVGQSRFDESMRLNIVSPERIDVLTALEQMAPPPAPPAPPADAAPADAGENK